MAVSDVDIFRDVWGSHPRRMDGRSEPSWGELRVRLVGYLSWLPFKDDLDASKVLQKTGGVCCIILRYVKHPLFQDLTSSSMSIFCWRCFCFQLPMDWLIWFSMGWNGSSQTVVGPQRIEHHGVFFTFATGWRGVNHVKMFLFLCRTSLLPSVSVPKTFVHGWCYVMFTFLHPRTLSMLPFVWVRACILWTLSYMLDTCLTLLGWEWQHLVFWIEILRFFNHPLKPRHHLQCCLSNRCFEKGQQTRLWHLCDKRMAR